MENEEDKIAKDLLKTIQTIIDDRCPQTKDHAKEVAKELMKELDKVIADKVKMYLSKILEAAMAKVEEKKNTPVSKKNSLDPRHNCNNPNKDAEDLEFSITPR